MNSIFRLKNVSVSPLLCRRVLNTLSIASQLSKDLLKIAKPHEFVQLQPGSVSDAPELLDGLSALTEDQALLRPDWDRGGKTKANSLSPLYAAMRKLIDENKGCVCLIQVGSFYELYFEQALIVGPQLGIKVTTRKTSNYAVPMAGFPTLQLQKFVKILVHDLQLNVAIIDQFENIKSDSDLKHRKISRIVSPGTLVDESFINFSNNNFLVAISPNLRPDFPPDPDTMIGISWVDVSVGELFVQQTTLRELPGDLRRISPSEVILPKEFSPVDGRASLLSEMADLKKYFVRYHKTTYGDYKLHFQNELRSTRKLLESLSMREEAAMNLVLSYVNVNLPDRRLLLDPPIKYVNSKFLSMDLRTRDALELTGRSTFGSVSVVGSLLNTLKRTVTAAGSRLLIQWIKLPILDENEIAERQDLVGLFKDNPMLRLQVANHLSQVGDFVRSLQRLALKSGSPVVHLTSIATGIERLAALRGFLEEVSTSLDKRDAGIVSKFLHKFEVPEEVAQRISDTIIAEEEARELQLPLEEPQSLEEQLISSTENSIKDVQELNLTGQNDANLQQDFAVRKDYNKELSSLHSQLEDNVRSKADALDHLKSCCIKIDPKAIVIDREQLGRHQNVIFISGRTSAISELARVIKTEFQADIREQRKSSLIVRTAVWTDIVEQTADITSKIYELERRILEELRQDTLAKVSSIRHTSRWADFLDICCSFGKLAHENDWVRPTFVKRNILCIEKGRHAVVESSLKESGQLFMANDTRLGDEGTLWVISGPNMGGKSTYLRQNALIVIMAQIGCFVPAKSAKLKIVDRLFTRIGASDDIYSDLSTFMVEMIETSNILANATTSSLAIVDEIGRGTSGKEGLAIAYATLLSLLKRNKCRTLFATHYGSELQQILEADGVSQDKLRFFRTKVTEHANGKTLAFDHALEPGISDRSYAFEVAKVAGFPTPSLKHAKRALSIILNNQLFGGLATKEE